MILSSLLSCIAFIITLTVLVFVHEYGHYFFAQFFGVRVEQFSIGFGPVLFSYRSKDGVQWCLSALPLGGFVKMYGDKDVSGLIKDNKTKADYYLSFNAKKLYEKIMIIAAGPLANLIFAIIILTFFYLSHGQSITSTIVQEVIHDSPASLAGIVAGDEIVKVDDQDINDFNDLKKIIGFGLGKKIKLKIKRDYEYLEFEVIPQFRDKIKDQMPYIGIEVPKKRIHRIMNLGQSVKKAVCDVNNVVVLTLEAIWSMLLGKRNTDSLGSFITIYSQSGERLSNGFFSFILFLASLSINVGLINLLPIPVLDGGRIILLLYEAVVKKSLSQQQSSFLINISALIIIFLIVISLSNDIKNLIS